MYTSLYIDFMLYVYITIIENKLAKPKILIGRFSGWTCDER